MATAWSNTPLVNRGADFIISGAASLTAAGGPVTLGLAIDLDNKKIWGRVGRGIWSGTSGDPATNTGGNDITSVVSGNVFPAWSPFNGSVSTMNCGNLPFEMDVPSGFTGWDMSGATTWDSGNKDASITLSNGNLTATGTASSAWKSVRGTTSHTSGKWYLELGSDLIDASSGWMGGVENASGVLNNYIGSTANGAGYQAGPTGAFWRNGGSATGLAVGLSSYSGAWRLVRSTLPNTTGKFYVELLCVALDSSNGWIAGITNASGPLQNFAGADNNSAGFQAQQSFWKNNTQTVSALPSALTATHILGLAIDLVNNRIWGRVDNGAWSTTGGTGDPAANTGGLDISSINTGGVYMAFSPDDVASTFDKVTANFGASAFTYTAPTGFVSWDTGAAGSAHANSAVTIIGMKKEGNPHHGAIDPCRRQPLATRRRQAEPSHYGLGCGGGGWARRGNSQIYTRNQRARPTRL